MKKDSVIAWLVGGLIGLIIVGLAVAYFGFQPGFRQAAAAAPTPTQAQPGWQAPSPQLQHDDDDLRAFQQEVLKEQSAIEAMKAIKHYQADLDRGAGLSQRVQQEAKNEAPQHPGMVFDLDSGYWIPNPHPAPAPTDPALGNAAKPPAVAVPSQKK